MNSIRQKSYEGIRACLRALQSAQEAAHQQRPEGIQSVRRISRFLQRSSALPKDPLLSQAFADLEKASEKEIGPRLDALILRLEMLNAQTTADPMVLLLVGNEADTLTRLKKELHAGNRELQAAKTFQQAETFLTSQKDFSLVVIHLDLPDGDGRDLLVRIRETPATAHIPIIVLSSMNDDKVKTECFALGADAYFESPYDMSTLVTEVAAKLQRQVDLTQRSTLDAVTRLPNRTVFYNAFPRVARLASRTKEPLTVALLDLDRFKAVNDLSGHQMGDRVLQKTSAILLKTLRTSDLLVRWGGEEFAILFPNTNVAQARQALNKALVALRKQSFETPEGREFRITFSAGVTPVEDGKGVETAIAEADHYLNLAKSAGRNHVLSKEDRLDDLKRNILLVEDDDLTASLLRRFLEKEGFRIFHAKDGKSAEELSSEATYSLITLDIRLPDVDGFDLLNRFRMTPTLRHVPIIMLTSTASEEKVLQGFRMGADDYVVKPFSPAQFLARVRRFLDKRS